MATDFGIFGINFIVDRHDIFYATITVTMQFMYLLLVFQGLITYFLENGGISGSMWNLI